MTKTITERLVATVIEVTDLCELYPSIAGFKGRIGLDVRVEHGSLSIGKKVRLRGPGSEEEVEIAGIEMLYNSNDPDTVRILCLKPKTSALPTGKVKSWALTD